MNSDHQPTEPVQPPPHPHHPYRERWHIFLHVYTKLNRLSHHLLSIFIKFSIALFLLFCVIFAVLRFALLPHIGDYKSDIERMLGSSLERSVSIKNISASWQGLRPSFELQQVAIHDEQGLDALVLPKVQVTVSWLSLLIADLRLYHLEIDQPELTLKRSADGKMYIAGWWLDPSKKGDARALDWILSQYAIVINDGVLHWIDQQQNAPVLTLSNVNLILHNRWQHHQLSLNAVPPANLAGPLDVRADFKHSPFSENISDFLDWKGLLYVDLAKTDLAAWDTYIDYPFEIQQGTGEVRAWFTFDKAQIVDVTADIKLNDVKTRLRKDLQLLDLLHVSGRISAQEIVTPSNVAELIFSVADRLRANGHQIELTNVTFEARSGVRLPPTTLVERFMPADKNKEEQFQFSTKFLDLTVLTQLAQYFPLPSKYADLLKKIEPAGQLFDFSIRLQGQLPKLSSYQVTGNFTNLALQSQKIRQLRDMPADVTAALSTIPGFTNLSGYVDINEKKGAVQIASKKLLLQLPAAFAEPELTLDAVDMKANWIRQQDEQVLITLSKLSLLRDKTNANFFGTHLVSTKPAVQPGKTKDHTLGGELDLTGTISQLDVPTIKRYLPVGMDDDLHHWMTNGLLEGQIKDVNVRIKGNLNEFPFENVGLLDQSMFRLMGNIVNAKINYLPGDFAKDGVSPYWPILSKINGKIIFDKQSMEVQADSAETDGIPIQNVRARFPNLYNHSPILEIDGEVNAAAQAMLHYVSVSPVLGWIDNFTQDTKVTGNAKLKLRLDIPLMQPLNTKVAGQVQFNGNDANLLRELPLFTQVRGRLEFDERGLNLNAMRANFLGGATTVVGGTQKDGVIRIRAEGQLVADGLRSAYPALALKPLLARMDGKTPYTATIQVKNKRTEIWVESSLSGMTLRLPAPLNKAASDNLHLRFELVNKSNNAVKEAVERDEIKLTLGGVVSARYLRQRESGANAWKVTSGGIGINAPAPTPDSGLSAHLELTSFNLDELQVLIPDDEPNSNAAVLPKAGGSPQFTAPTFSQYVEPDLLSVRATELILMGKKINQVVLGATRLNGIWRASIDSKQISGYLSWDDSDQSLGHVTANLDTLIIPETSTNDVVDLLQDKHVHSSIPGLDVVIENVELFGKKMGRLQLQAKNVNSKNDESTNDWQIDTLSLTNPDAELTAQGKWVSGKPAGKNKEHSEKSQTNLKYQLTLINAGKLLDRLGYAQVVSGGKGKLNGEISWNGSPYSMNIPSMSGKVQLDLQSGRFLKVDPGAAKLLAVVNLQSLPRRLMLDFRDVFSEGFAFEGITGDAQIEKGIAKSDNFKMRGMTATVLISGTANIVSEVQDLHVVVIPEVNAGGASVVYGLAVNPVIGVGTFLAQLFLREPLMRAFTFEYQISGPWKEPNVVKLK